MGSRRFGLYRWWNFVIVAFEKYAACVAEAAVLNANHWLELYGKVGYRFDHGGLVDLEAINGFVYYILH